MPSNRSLALIRWFWSTFSRYMCVCDARRALRMILTAQPLLCLCSGLLDAESSLTERSEHFFSELRIFRQVNKDECVHSGSSWSEGKPHVSTLLCFSLSFYPVLCDFLYVWEYMRACVVSFLLHDLSCVSVMVYWQYVSHWPENSLHQPTCIYQSCGELELVIDNCGNLYLSYYKAFSYIFIYTPGMRTPDRHTPMRFFPKLLPWILKRRIV